MSLISQTYPIPLWLLILGIASAVPLWFQWFKKIRNRFQAKATLEAKLSKETGSREDSTEVFNKATENWNASVSQGVEAQKLEQAKRASAIHADDQPYIKIVLKVLAINGDAGMLLQSIADRIRASSNEIKSSLKYLEENEFVESVATGSGTKYYLASRGKNYCIKRGYIAE